MGATRETETTPLQQQQQPQQISDHDATADHQTSSSSITKCLLDFYTSNSFLINVALAIVLAKVYPPLGAVYAYPQITATWLAVIFIFLMAGLSLKSTEFAKAVSRLWFNVYVLAFNFFVISGLVYGVTVGIRYGMPDIPKGLTDGMVVCACMPVTASMVIVLSKSAKGDEAVAVLQAAVGSLLGVFVSPLLLLFYIGVQSDLSLADVFVKLTLRVLVPIVVGQLLQVYSTAVVHLVERNKKYFKSGQEWTLVFIVYTVFCKTFSKPLNVSVIDILWTLLFQCLCLLLCMSVAWYSLKLLFRNEPRLRVTGLYCCTQKSVAMGIPLIGAVYENDPRAGLFALPLLIWHPAQLLMGSALAPRLADGVDQLEGYLALPEIQRERQSMRRSFFSSGVISAPIRRASSVAFEPSEELLRELQQDSK